MDSESAELTLDCLIHVFSFLTDVDLLNASGVNKFWHEAAETPWLWRQMCLQRWSFCNIAQSSSENGRLTWKSYYLRRSSLELKMKTGRSSLDYTCKSLRGHTGIVAGFVYLVENSQHSELWNASPVVCSASSDGTVRAWNVREGVQLWSSLVQSPLTGIAVDPKHKVVFTSDSTGVIKTWDGCTGQEVASFPTSTARCKLLPRSFEDQSALFVGTGGGALYSLTSPTLSLISHQVIFDSFSLDLLVSSPDKKWILAETTENTDSNPKVFFSQSLICPADGDPPLSQSLPVSGCLAAVFLPSDPARVAVVHDNEVLNSKSLSVFEIVLKKSKYKVEVLVNQVESFKLPVDRWNPDILLQAQGASTFVVAQGNILKVYTLKGALLATFEDHTQPIVSLCVDSFRVVTASRDLSLRVLTWKKEKEGGLSLESRFHLLGGSHTMARGFTNVACDYASIVASVESTSGKDILRVYSFNS
ncbi:F-box/WD repeat-containing protein 12 isoform X1 [Arapaima gigas]